MAGKFHHEGICRGPGALARLAATRVTLCGAGAVGSHPADNLVRQGLGPLHVIDRDRVLGGERGGWSLTLRDFGVRPLEAPASPAP